MIVQRVVGAGIAAARSGVRVVRGASSHALWWLDHNLSGRPRKAPDDPRRRSRPGR
jgi:hypothetical protein